MRGLRGVSIRLSVGVVAVLVSLLLGSVTVTAGDNYSNPNINFPGNTILDRVAAGFATIGDHLDEVVYVTATVQSCTNQVWRIDGNRSKSLFATLPGCGKIDVDVNTDGTSAWPTKFLHVFISQGQSIWILPPTASGVSLCSATGVPTGCSTVPAQTLTAECASIFGIGLDDAKLYFAGNLVVQCTTATGLTRLLELTPGGSVVTPYLAELSGLGFGLFGFAPRNWRTHGGKVLIYQSGGTLRAIFRTGTTAMGVTNLGGPANVYGIPGVYLPLFNGETGAFAQSAGSRLNRWTWTPTNPTGARGGVLLWNTSSGSRVIVHRDADEADLTLHTVSGSDGDWGPMAFEAKECNPVAFEKDNTGSRGTVNCVAFSNAGFDAVNDIDWGTVWCGVYGGVGDEAQAFPKGMGKDVDKDGDLDQEFTFNAKEAPLLAETPGAVPFCTFKFTNPHGGGM